ncbi:hypothetical protein NBRC116494_02480 [Aurantivibrio plasticivorans]
MLLIECVLLLFAANGAPVIARKLFLHDFDFPVDGYHRFSDGNRVFGESKTWRGVFTSIAACMVLACVLQLSWLFGCVIALRAMLGDLLSSFAKRRLEMPSSARCSGVDQLPEAIIPGLFVVIFFEVSLTVALSSALVFVAGDILLSPILFKLGLRKVPY